MSMVQTSQKFVNVACERPLMALLHRILSNDFSSTSNKNQNYNFMVFHKLGNVLSVHSVDRGKVRKARH